MTLTPESSTEAPTTTAAFQPPLLDHERLDTYRVPPEFAAMAPALTHAARPSLRDQLERASS